MYLKIFIIGVIFSTYCFSNNIEILVSNKNAYNYKINGKIYDIRMKLHKKQVNIQLKKVQLYLNKLEKNSQQNYKSLYVMYKNYLLLSMKLNTRKSHEEAFKIEKKMIRLILSNKKADRRLLVAEYNNLTSLYLHLNLVNKYKEAIEYQKEALKIAKNLKGIPLNELSYGYYNLSRIYQAFAFVEGRKKRPNSKKKKRNYLYQALHNQNKSKNIDEAILTKEDILMAINYQNIANIYKELASKKDLKKSKLYIQKSLEIYRKKVPKNDRNYVDARIFLYDLNKIINKNN